MAVTGAQVRPAQCAARFDFRALVAFFALAYALSWSWVISLTATLILASLWFLWHLPQFAVIATYRGFGPAGSVGMFLGLTCGAIVLTWLYNRSGGSILLVIIWHGAYNFVSGTQAATGMLAAIVSTLIMVQGIILVLLELRARHRGLPSVLGPP